MAYQRKRKAHKKGSATKPKATRMRRKGEFHGDDPLEGDAVPQATRQFWDCEDATACADAAWSWVDRLRTQYSADAMMDLVHEAVYRGRPIGSSGGTMGRQYLLLRSGVMLNLNIVMSMVDTATARLTKRRPMPMISADDARYSQRRFAKRCSRVLRRKVGGTQVSSISPDVIRDMCIRGDGVFKAEIRDGDVHAKRIPVYELVWDPFEAEQGSPRTLAHVRPEPRSVMAARYPKFAREIMEAPVYSRQDPWATWAYQSPAHSDYIEVRELWHLPSGCDAEDGQHVVTVRGAVICREPWRWDDFPVSQTQWSAPTRGVGRGCGLVEQLLGIQEQINEILRDAREGLKHGSQLVIFAQRGSNVNKHHLRKRWPAVVEHDGPEPHYVAPNPVSEQAIRILLMLIEQAYQISGISQMAAQSKNTLGAGASGKAIDTMDDIQSDRFAHVESSWQQARVKLGKCLTWLASDLYKAAHGKNDNEHCYEEQPEYGGKDELAAWIAGTDWSKLDLDSGDYHLVLEPVNYLADSREGRLSQVAELGKNGLIPDPAIQADLFDEPDIQAANRIILGPKHKLDMMMEGLADPDVPMFELLPDQYTNLALGVLMAKGELNEAEASRKFDREDPELEVVCERFREWIEHAKQQIDLAKSGDASVSPAGAMPANMVAAQSAATLQPDLMAPPPVTGPAGGAPMPPIPIAA